MGLLFERPGNPAWCLFGCKDQASPRSASTPNPLRKPSPRDQPYALRKETSSAATPAAEMARAAPLERDLQAVLADGHFSPDYAEQVTTCRSGWHSSSTSPRDRPLVSRYRTADRPSAGAARKNYLGERKRSESRTLMVEFWASSTSSMGPLLGPTWQGYGCRWVTG